MVLRNTEFRVNPHLCETALCAWVGSAAAGDRLAYHRGFLAVDTAPERNHLFERERVQLARMARRARLLAAQGLAHLVQYRHGPGDFTYFLIAATRPRRVTEAFRFVPERQDTRQPPASAPYRHARAKSLQCKEHA